MYITSMILEGFKSYGKRIEINGFDKEFNAITGLNGSGKSNILDAICFVLGISNLGQVRAASLQELVYKSGQAGIKKASVTIVFNNRDKKSSPLGYEDYNEITVTRQVVIDGKNKYMINGSNVQNKRVQDMFCSVQLNVNNPHFLIMQGRITKVLNMKPPEILSMIEEAAGTKMYENKKRDSLKLIEKKDNKLKEINEILRDELGPKIEKLKEERQLYVEYQRIERELQHCKKFHVAWRYVNAVKQSAHATEEEEKLKLRIQELEQSIKDGKEEIKGIERKITEINEKKKMEQDNKMDELEKDVRNAEKQEHKLTAELKSNKEKIKAAEKAIEQLKINIAEDEKMLEKKEKELEKVGSLFDNLKEQDRKDAEAVLAAQENYQKIGAGLLQCDNGENATLEQQLIQVKKIFSEARSEITECEMKLKHDKQQIERKKPQLQNTDSDYGQDKRKLDNLQKEIKNLDNELKKLNYQDGFIESLEEQKHNLLREIKKLQDQIDNFEGQFPRLRFNYQDPEPNFRRNSVKGLVCKLISLKDKKKAFAVEMAAGGKLYNVMVDTEQTGKKLLQRGQLQSRVTFIPLNKVTGNVMDRRIVETAENLVGRENVELALSTIDFPEETRSAMNWIFGQIFICKDFNVAKQVAYHKNIMRKCITLQGDAIDPSGVLSGGSDPVGGSILLKLDGLKDAQNALNEKEQTLNQINNQISQTKQIAQKYATFKQQLDIKNHELQMTESRLQHNTHHQLKQEIEQLEKSIAELTERIKVAKETEQSSSKKVKEFEAQLKDVDNIREKQLKEAEKKLNALKQKSDASKQSWQKHEREAETLNLEIEDIKKAIETGKNQLTTMEDDLKVIFEKNAELETELKEANGSVEEAKNKLKEKKAAINQHNLEIQKLLSNKDNIIKQGQEVELTIKKLSHDVSAMKTTASEYKNKVQELIRKYDWIKQDEQFFGERGGVYDFEAHNPEVMGQKVRELENKLSKLSRTVNTRAMIHLNQEEEQYNDLMKKRKILETDKKKILDSIKKLDEKKKMTLLEAWEKVNKDFGSIFSSLLPGADAKIEPPENQTVLEGLEVKVSLCDVWKESLGELSGGQRSLVALSLILAMLLFKPAPLYILDEVDAALDLSHTENIGIMLKRHFRHSQFIVVSLKNGMFNNANVLFKTRFVDGMSTITRTERAKSK